MISLLPRHTFHFGIGSLNVHIKLLTLSDAGVWRLKRWQGGAKIALPPYGSVSAGQEKWPFNVIFFLKVEPPSDQT